jgi:tetratricopeptide (TPR) repeat protein
MLTVYTVTTEDSFHCHIQYSIVPSPGARRKTIMTSSSRTRTKSHSRVSLRTSTTSLAARADLFTVIHSFLGCTIVSIVMTLETSPAAPDLPAVEQIKIQDIDDTLTGASKMEMDEEVKLSKAPADALSANDDEVAPAASDDPPQTFGQEENPVGDDLSSTGDEDEEDISDDEVSAKGKEDPELLLIKANTLKEEGNNFFKENDFKKASRAYRHGTNTLKPLNRGNTGDEQVRALLVSLQTNLSMTCLKLGKVKQSAQVASSALEVDPTNVKALYRRALASRQLGDTESAKADLKQALEIDPGNIAVKKELASLKKSIEDAKNAQKKGLQKAFSKSGSGLGLLYDDKEREKQRKAEEAKRKKQEEEESLKKRKSQWEDECVKRMAKGEEVISFDEWEQKRKKKEKEAEKQKKEERRKAREAARASAKEEDDSDEELTEKELAQLRGYKKTADGRITSYFTREQSANEKSLIGDIAPQRLEASNTPSPTTPLSTETGKGNPSAWNQAGTTWEEKNTTEWCRERLEFRLKESKAEVGALVAVVTTVDNMTGDASVAIASGKKRYIFDFHCTVKFEIRDPATEDTLATGSLRLPDICSTHHEELEVEQSGWKKKPNSRRAQEAETCLAALVPVVRESVTTFVADFNKEY